MKIHVARVNKPVIAAGYLTQICKGINSRALYDCFIGNFVTNWYFLSAEIDRKKRPSIHFSKRLVTSYIYI